MIDWIADRTQKYQEFFELSSNAHLLTAESAQFELKPETAAALKHFNIEWHYVPTAEAISFDDAYLKKFYPTNTRLSPKSESKTRESLMTGHRRQQGFIVGIETTPKPVYLPHARQFYGTKYGHDETTDPIAQYFGQAGLTTGTRYDQNYRLLRRFFEIINEDWRKRNILPQGYRVTVCPPGIFNLVGTIFHPEWSETETLELGFYRDERGNATCFAVGSNAPGDFSFIDVIEGEEWSLTGFRLALLPDETRHDAKNG
ncbi:MAG: hypothetical protein ABI954_12640 [Pyrinomonadaceae bacterium]